MTYWSVNAPACFHMSQAFNIAYGALHKVYSSITELTGSLDGGIKKAISECFTAPLHKMTIMHLIIYPWDLSANYAQLASGGEKGNSVGYNVFQSNC